MMIYFNDFKDDILKMIIFCFIRFLGRKVQ